MEKEYHSLKKMARTAGVWYLLISVTAIYGVLYVPSKLIVKGDAVATADNILKNEFFYRSGIVSAGLSTIIMVVLVLSLYRLLKIINEQRARIMVALIVLGTPIAFFIEVFKITALMNLKGTAMKGVAAEEQHNIIQLLFRLHENGGFMVGILWGLWLIPLAQLIYNSGFIPRIFAVLMLLAGMGYIIDWFTFMLFPGYGTMVSKFTMFLHPLEIPIIFWLLIKGVKNNITVGEPILNKQ
jgi:Domain of unknown function (DUF4386)